MEALKDHPFPRLFRLLEAACMPWSRASLCLSSASFMASPTLTLRSLFYKNSCLHWAQPGNLLTHSLPVITPAKSPLPRKVTYSQVSGIRVWTFWGRLFCLPPFVKPQLCLTHSMCPIRVTFFSSPSLCFYLGSMFSTRI